jgi:hypothetical protein
VASPAGAKGTQSAHARLFDLQIASYAVDIERRVILQQGPQAPVAQLDRAPDFESGGQGFESLPAHQ